MKSMLRVKPQIFLAILIGIGGFIVIAFYGYNRYQMARENPDLTSKGDVKGVTTAVTRFMDLPLDEVPTLATVTDQEKLKDQDFFKKALNGDKVLMYTKAHKIIMYRPSTDRIIEFVSYLRMQ